MFVTCGSENENNLVDTLAKIKRTLPVFNMPSLEHSTIVSVTVAATEVYFILTTGWVLKVKSWNLNIKTKPRLYCLFFHCKEVFLLQCSPPLSLHSESLQAFKWTLSDKASTKENTAVDFPFKDLLIIHYFSFRIVQQMKNLFKWRESLPNFLSRKWRIMALITPVTMFKMARRKELSAKLTPPIF